MTDNKKRKVRSLKAVKAKYLESHPKIREWIEFTIDDEPDAKEFRIHAPIFQSNEEKKAFAKAQESDDQFDLAKALLGAQWDDFIEAGGQISLLSSCSPTRPMKCMRRTARETLQRFRAP